MSSSVSSVKSNKMAKNTKTPVPATQETVAATTPKPRGRRPTTPAQAEVVVPTTSTPNPASASVTAVTTEVRSAESILNGLQETLKSLNTEFSTRIRTAVHDAQDAIRSMKREARDGKRRKRVDPTTLSPEALAVWEARRANNAFLKVRPLSDELCSFMGLSAKSLKSQTDVTKFISNYVKTHNCFDPTFKRRILPDAKLAKLLRVTDKNEVTYLNLQSFLKVHFLKPAVVA
jgi:chromatin remodeling complex protein RSC6